MSTITTLVVPDTHFPYQDAVGLHVLGRVVEVCQPNRIVFIGDWLDNYSVSQYVKDPERVSQLAWEIMIAGEALHDLAREVDDYWFCEGNHELRLPKYIAEHAPELAGITPSLQQMWAIPDDRWVPYHKHITLGSVSYVHDIGHGGKYALHRTLDAFGQAVVFGHTHCGGVVHDADVHGRGRFALNVGWLGDATFIDYRSAASCRSWRHGFGWVVETVPSARAGRLAPATTCASFIPIENGTALVSGEVVQ